MGYANDDVTYVSIGDMRTYVHVHREAVELVLRYKVDIMCSLILECVL